MRKIAIALFLGFLIVGILSLATGQMPSILPISPITQSIIFQKNVTILGSGGNVARRTTAALNYTIGSGGDYATIEAAVVDLPDFIDHVVTLTIKKGTAITTDPDLSNLRGVGFLLIVPEIYLPKPPVYSIPTADSAGTIYLQDTSIFTVDDTYNDCWIFIVNGTGINNGFVKITDTVASTGRIMVAAWPGTQPDGTSKYIIVGALFGDSGGANGLTLTNIDINVFLYGIGFAGGSYAGIYADHIKYLSLYWCGFYGLPYDGVYVDRSQLAYFFYCGFVGNNSENDAYNAGIHILNCQLVAIGYNYIQGNLRQGIFLEENTYAEIDANVGTNNGTWGTYAIDGSVARHSGTKCSGSSGNYSNGAGDGSIAY